MDIKSVHCFDYDHIINNGLGYICTKVNLKKIMSLSGPVEVGIVMTGLGHGFEPQSIHS